MDVSFILTFVLGVALGFVIAALAHGASGNFDRDALRREAIMFVAAAERLMPGATGEQKLGYVMGMLGRLGAFKQLDQRVVRAAVEWAVGAWKKDLSTCLPVVELTDKYTQHEAIDNGNN